MSDQESRTRHRGPYGKPEKLPCWPNGQWSDTRQEHKHRAAALYRGIQAISEKAAPSRLPARKQLQMRELSLRQSQTATRQQTCAPSMLNLNGSAEDPG